jgi:hypothetical protein
VPVAVGARIFQTLLVPVPVSDRIFQAPSVPVPVCAKIFQTQSVPVAVGARIFQAPTSQCLESIIFNTVCNREIGTSVSESEASKRVPIFVSLF